MIEKVQSELQKNQVDGWLLYDFRRSNELAHIFLKIPSHSVATRRFFYWIPKKGEPVKLVHAIEQHVLDALPGKKSKYLSWQSLEEKLQKILKGSKRIAMEYSPKNQIPYVSRVDGGTIDLIRSFGIEVVSSADFLVERLTKGQIESQIRAAKALEEIVEKIWKWLPEKITEYDVQQKILEEFRKRGLITEHAPIVAVGPNSADPHYEPLKEKSSLIQKGDFLLIDLWAKESSEDAIFADLTKVALLDRKPTERQTQIFEIVRRAQRQAFSLIEKRFSRKERIEGAEVDDAARGVIEEAGFGEYFIHRTGHSIDRTLHGSGVHMDNLEIHDVRALTPASCFSIEPGIYLPNEFGVRLEFDVIIHEDGRVEITGGEQDGIACLF